MLTEENKMKFIKDFFFNMKINRIKKKISRLQTEALHLQRNGKLRHYASVMSEIDQLEKEITNESG